MKPIIYADNAATTPLSPIALEAMEKFWIEEFGNPSSLYTLGNRNKKVLSISRACIAKCINAEENELFFTSCGTESDNWALKGVAYFFKNKGKHIIVSEIEHHAILNTCLFLEKQGFEITYLPVNNKGEVEECELVNSIRPDTILVSIMLANNEIGTIQNIKSLAAIAHGKGIIFHTDAVQALGHIPVDVKELGVDLLSCSAHKFNGPKGVGFLYKNKNIDIEPLFHGGHQESELRAGTENIPLIVGMATALEEHIKSLPNEISYIRSLRECLIKKLYSNNLDFIINGSENSIPGTISLSFKNAQGEMLLHRLDLMGICVSTGSACDSINTNLSHVIKAIKIPEEYAFGTVRISISVRNTIDEMKIIANAIKKILV